LESRKLLIKINDVLLVIFVIFTVIILDKQLLLFIKLSCSLFSDNNFNFMINLSSFDLK